MEHTVVGYALRLTHPTRYAPPLSRRLRLLRRCRLHRAHVEVEQAFALVALVLVFLAQLDDLLEDLHVEAVALGFRENLLLLHAQLLQNAVEVLDPLDEGTDLAAGNGDVGHGASLLTEVVKMTAKK